MGIRALPNLPIICVLLACCISPGKLDAQPDNDLCQNAELIVLESGIPRTPAADRVTRPESGIACRESGARYTPRPAAVFLIRA